MFGQIIIQVENKIWNICASLYMTCLSVMKQRSYKQLFLCLPSIFSSFRWRENTLHLGKEDITALSFFY